MKQHACPVDTQAPGDRGVRPGNKASPMRERAGGVVGDSPHRVVGATGRHLADIEVIQIALAPAAGIVERVEHEGDATLAVGGVDLGIADVVADGKADPDSSDCPRHQTLACGVDLLIGWGAHALVVAVCNSAAPVHDVQAVGGFGLSVKEVTRSQYQPDAQLGGQAPQAHCLPAQKVPVVSLKRVVIDARISRQAGLGGVQESRLCSRRSPHVPADVARIPGDIVTDGELAAGHPETLHRFTQLMCRSIVCQHTVAMGHMLRRPRRTPGGGSYLSGVLI